MRNLIGQQIGPYKIEERIGTGGMADVYRAHQANLDRYVAIKVLKASLADDPEFVARFSREAMASGGLRHPNILRIYDAGTFEDRHYIVMDYASGGTLAQRAETHPLTIDEAADIGAQIAEALDYAHKRPHPIIHRDLKPSNILLDDGRPLLSDFGIAYIVSTEKRLTQTGSSVGTPEYMSPEQSEGYPVDGRTDIYSLGVILFQLVTGRVPFEANTPIATMHQVVYTPPPPPRQFRSDVPEWMESIILRALAKRPADRFATAGEMAEALRKHQVVPVALASGGEPAGLTQAAPRVKRSAPAVLLAEPSRGVEPARKSRTPMVALLLVGALVVLGGAAYLALPALRGQAGGAQQTAQTAAPPDVPPTVLPAAATFEPTRPTAAVIDTATAAALARAESAIVPETPAPISPSPLPPAATTAPTQPAPTEPAPTEPAPTATSAPPTNTTLPPTSTPVPPTRAPASVAVPSAPGTLLDFESFRSWRLGDQQYGTLTQSGEQAHGGKSSAKVAYDFPAVDNEFVVFLNTAETAIPGKPAALTAWVYGDGSGHYLNSWVRDSAGQVRQFPFGQVSHQGWKQMTAPLDTSAAWPQGHISGIDDAQLVFPLSLHALVLDAVPHGKASSGSIFLDDMATSDTAVPVQVSNRSTPSGGSPAPTVQPGGSSPSALTGHVVFPGASGDGRLDIMAVDAAGGDVRTVVSNGHQPALRSGGRIAFNGVGGGRDNLSAVNLDGSGLTTMSNHTEDAYPSWSPDGATLVLYSSAAAGENRLYTLPDGSREMEPDPVQYGGHGLLGQFPTWLGNGRMAYSGCGYQWGSGGLCGIWSVNSNGTDPQRLTDTGDDHPTDSRAGRLLFNRQAGGNMDVYVTSDTGGPAVNLTNSPSQDFGASFSPDGRSIAFMSNRDGWSIWVMNADGSGQRKLASVPGGFGAQWQDERASWGS